jgi:hypothetical protein
MSIDGSGMIPKARDRRNRRLVRICILVQFVCLAGCSFFCFDKTKRFFTSLRFVQNDNFSQVF